MAIAVEQEQQKVAFPEIRDVPPTAEQPAPDDKSEDTIDVDIENMEWEVESGGMSDDSGIDYDDYSKRLRAIPQTNRILAELRQVLDGYPELKRIDEPYRSRVLEVIERHDRQGFVDYITLSASIVFSAR